MTDTRRVAVAAPCPHCPFRSDVPIFLTAVRRSEIARSLLQGDRFFCHETVDYDTDDDGEVEADVSDSVMCAGSIKSMLKSGTPNQAVRMASAMGLIDLERIEATGAACWSLTEWQTLREGATAEDRCEPADEEEEPEAEPCSTSGPHCLAPAGWLVEGGVVYGTEPADGECATCCEPLCEACADAEGNCYLCTELE